MSRKHFKALADSLNSIRPSAIGLPGSKEREAFIQWTHSVEAVASVCAQFNGRFKADRFRDACGWTDENYATAADSVSAKVA